MNASILKEAFALVNDERHDEYGPPHESFGRVALLWGAWLGRPLSAHDVACMMVLFKLAREAHGHKRDNLLDAAGYVGLAADCARVGEDGPC